VLTMAIGVSLQYGLRLAPDEYVQPAGTLRPAGKACAKAETASPESITISNSKLFRRPRYRIGILPDTNTITCLRAEDLVTKAHFPSGRCFDARIIGKLRERPDLTA
jgi:hypothetical protein